MSLTDAVTKGPPTKRVDPAAKQARILTLDIERLPGQATLKHRGLTITGEFWDLNAWKHTIGRRIHPDDVTQWPRSICAAAKWYDQRTVMFTAEWEDGGHEAFLRQTWEWYDAADIIVGHNLDRFDTKHLKAGWAEYGWPAPAPTKSVDTLKVARSVFAFESNTLDALCKRLGVPAKSDKYDVATARAACNGDTAAQRKLANYNKGDIRATEAAYDRLRPWIPNHPNLGLYTNDDRACPNCGSDKRTLLEKDAVTGVTRYAMYRCARCGGTYRANHMRHRVVTRPVR